MSNAAGTTDGAVPPVPSPPAPTRRGMPFLVPLTGLLVAFVLVGTTVINASAEDTPAATATAMDHHAATGSTDSATTTPTGSATTEHDHGATAVVAPQVYDPTKPVDLSGVAGVSAAQEARAEKLVTTTLDELPQFADTATAVAQGYKSIGDSLTGVEHFINWDYLTDGRILDPNHPESLVYDSTVRGKRTLVSAMFMLEKGSTFDDVPDIGGALTQWHIHDNLCFTNDPVAPRVLGITTSEGTCRPPLQKLTPVPMIHVWIVKNKCGPFAALEGIGAGQTEGGAEKSCDHVHGGS